MAAASILYNACSVVIYRYRKGRLSQHLLWLVGVSFVYIPDLFINAKHKLVQVSSIQSLWKEFSVAAIKSSRQNGSEMIVAIACDSSLFS